MGVDTILHSTVVEEMEWMWLAIIPHEPRPDRFVDIVANNLIGRVVWRLYSNHGCSCSLAILGKGKTGGSVSCAGVCSWLWSCEATWEGGRGYSLSDDSEDTRKASSEETLPLAPLTSLLLPLLLVLALSSQTPSWLLKTTFSATPVPSAIVTRELDVFVEKKIITNNFGVVIPNYILLYAYIPLQGATCLSIQRPLYRNLCPDHQACSQQTYGTW